MTGKIIAMLTSNKKQSKNSNDLVIHSQNYMKIGYEVSTAAYILNLFRT